LPENIISENIHQAANILTSIIQVCIVVLGFAGIGAFIRRRLLKGRSVKQAVTWDCGYAAPTSRIQYTASSLAQMIVTLFNWVLRPRTHKPHVEGVFPHAAQMHSHVDDAVLDKVLLPFGSRIEKWFGWFRRFQHGMIQQYVLYILIAVILMLSTLIPFEEFITRLFAR